MKAAASWIAVAVLTLGFVAPGQGATYTWDGGGTDTNFSTAANWNPDGAPVSGTTTSLTFTGSKPNINTDIDFTTSGITFTGLASPFTLAGTGTLTLYGNAGNSGIDSSSGTAATINSNIVTAGLNPYLKTTGAGGVTYGGSITSTSGSNLVVRPNAGTITLNGAISGAGNVQYNAVAATSTAFINGANTFTGGSSIFTGTWIVGVSDVGTGSTATSGAFGAGSGTLIIGTTGAGLTSTVEIAGAHTLIRNFQIATDASNAANNTVATLGGSTADTSTYSGSVLIGSSSGLGTSLTVTAASGGRVNFTGTVGQGTTTTASSLTKTGAGIVAFSNTVSNAGATAVNAGTLLVNGTFSSSTNTVALASGTTLGGTGTIAGAVTSTGGIVSAGDMNASGVSMVGTLTLQSGLTLDGNTHLKFDLGATNASDLVAVTGNLTLDGTLDLTSFSGFGAGNYTLFSYTGTLTNNTLNLGTTIAGYNYVVDTGTAGMVKLDVTAVPEPGTMAFLGFGALVLLLAVRRARTA